MFNKFNRQFKYHITNKNQLSVLLGTLLEHFDSSLYGFMAPLLAPLFFPNVDPINGIIFIFLTYPITYLSKPLGAYYIGRIGDKFGRKRALQISMLGMGMATIAMGLLPTYETIGIAAPIILVLTRMAQIFFVSGESNGGAIFMLEHSKPRYYGRTSGFYCAFTALGIFLGSVAASWVIKNNGLYWRVPYVIGIATAICALYLRYKTTETPAFEKAQYNESAPIPYRQIVNLIVISAFARILYMIPSVLVVTFIPLATNIPTAIIMKINNIILLIYALSLPFMGQLTDKFTPQKMLEFSISMTILLSYPLFCLFYYKNLYLIFFSKLILVLLTACFYSAIHPWYLSKFKVKQRYKFVSVSYSIGAQIGASAPAIAMTIYKQTGLISSYTLMIIFFGILSLMLIRRD